MSFRRLSYTAHALHRLVPLLRQRRDPRALDEAVGRYEEVLLHLLVTAQSLRVDHFFHKN